LTQLYESISRPVGGGSDILQMQEEQFTPVLSDRRRRIAAALKVVRYVEQQLDILGIHRRHDGIDRRRRLADGAHVVMEACLDAERSGLPSYLCHQTGQPKEIGIGSGGLISESADELEVFAARLGQILSVGNVGLDGLFFLRRIDLDQTAGQGDEAQLL